MSETKYARALERIAIYAERRRTFPNKDELVVLLGDIANRALHNRRGPGTQIYVTGEPSLTCPECLPKGDRLAGAKGHTCFFHSK